MKLIDNTEILSKKNTVSTNTNFVNAISLKVQEIDGLKENMATLINGTVTGKIKVN